MKNTIVIISITLLSGCASTYVPPQNLGENAATLIVPSTQKSWHLYGASSSRIHFGFADENGCSSPYEVEKPKDETQTNQTISIPPGKKTMVGASITHGTWNCETFGWFIPVAGQTYKVLAMDDMEACGITVAEVSPDNKLTPQSLGEASKNMLTNKLCIK